jgi:selenide,water dikinase
MEEHAQGPGADRRRLTERVACAGCAAKLGPAELGEVLRGIDVVQDPRVLVGLATGDDAGVLRLDAETALVQTVDFFTPVVDDPFAFGAIAAANALSDVYAMGGRPLSALAIAGFPERDFPQEWARAIVQGGASALREAGCVLLGGHTIRDPEIKFGYAVTGVVHPEKLLTNAQARPGERLVLTKALGTGVIATALKAGEAPEAVAAAAARSMRRLNAEAGAAAVRHGVRAATDVTGFGLAGHAWNIARESGVALEIAASRLPLLPGALELAEHYQPGGLRANRRAFSERVSWQSRPAASLEALVFDPQTSGGLLLCVEEGRVEALLRELPDAREIGRVAPPQAPPLVFF